LLFDLLLNPIASIINRGIDGNDQAQNLCDALDGRSLRIAAKPWPDQILISAVDGLVDISSDDQQQADAEISGTLIELNRLMFIDNRAPLREGHVEITGDVDIADRFRELLLCARPDLEEELADWFGASMAARFTNFVRDTRDRMADVAEDLTERAADHLHENTQQLPVPAEINTHFGSVDEFVNSVERLEARIERLLEKQSA
jgi:ubiquinone biosynthesis protein UbiJ